MTIHVSLPKAAKEAADRGDLLSAIKLTQETMGVGLQDAQQAVHAYVRGSSETVELGVSDPGSPHNVNHGNLSHTTAVVSGLPPQALIALNRGNVIEAIKHTRNTTGLGLKEAKDKVENYLARNPHAKQKFEAARMGGINPAPFVAVVVLLLVTAGAVAAYVFSAVD